MNIKRTLLSISAATCLGLGVYAEAAPQVETPGFYIETIGPSLSDLQAADVVSRDD